MATYPHPPLPTLPLTTLHLTPEGNEKKVKRCDERHDKSGMAGHIRKPKRELSPSPQPQPLGWPESCDSVDSSARLTPLTPPPCPKPDCDLYLSPESPSLASSSDPSTTTAVFRPRGWVVRENVPAIIHQTPADKPESKSRDVAPHTLAKPRVNSTNHYLRHIDRRREERIERLGKVQLTEAVRRQVANKVLRQVQPDYTDLVRL